MYIHQNQVKLLRKHNIDSKHILFGIDHQRLDAHVCMGLQGMLQTVSLTKFRKSSFAFDLRCARWDFLRSFQATCLNLYFAACGRMTGVPRNALLAIVAHHLRKSWLRRHPISNHDSYKSYKPNDDRNAPNNIKP